MPNIQEYSAGAEITPSDRGIQAAEVAGRRLGQFGAQIDASLKGIGDKIEQHNAVMESSELYKTGTELKLNLQQRYEQESALPENRNDPHFGDRFMTEVSPLLDQWGSSVHTDHGKMLAATLKSQIRNEVFNHVAAGQSEMDAAHVEDNLTQTVNGINAGLVLDPSEANLNRSIGTIKDAAQGVTMQIPDVAVREHVASEIVAQRIPQVVLSRYHAVGESIKNQIAQTGGETSPALEQLNKDIANQVGFQYLSPEAQSRIPEIRDEAVRQGQELYKSKHETDKSQTIEQGKAAFSELNTAITQLALKGQGPTPELVNTIGRYARAYGATNPGEVASLNDYLLKGQDRAQENKVEPYNQQVRDNIQGGMSLPSGDPRRPTLASITQAWSHGSITKEDLSNYTEILNKLDKPSEDPTFKPAWGNFERWQTQMVQSIGTKGGPGTAAARAQFLHDSTASFMAQGHGGAGWDKALDNITNAQNPHSFVHVTDWYNKAANHNAEWIQQHDQFRPGATTAPAYGSKAAPVYPSKQGGPVQPKKLDDKAVDAAFGVK